MLPATAELQVLTGATHLFEEPGALEAVADLGAAWFRRHLGGQGSPPWARHRHSGFGYGRPPAQPG